MGGAGIWTRRSGKAQGSLRKRWGPRRRGQRLEMTAHSDCGSHGHLEIAASLTLRVGISERVRCCPVCFFFYPDRIDAAGTRYGRILFSFGNRDGCCADHSSRGHLPGCCVVMGGPDRIEAFSHAILAAECAFWTLEVDHSRTVWRHVPGQTNCVAVSVPAMRVLPSLMARHLPVNAGGRFSMK